MKMEYKNLFFPKFTTQNIFQSHSFIAFLFFFYSLHTTLSIHRNTQSNDIRTCWLADWLRDRFYYYGASSSKITLTRTSSFYVKEKRKWTHIHKHALINAIGKWRKQKKNLHNMMHNKIHSDQSYNATVIIYIEKET